MTLSMLKVHEAFITVLNWLDGVIKPTIVYTYYIRMKV